jgi:hypothetical protein
VAAPKHATMGFVEQAFAIVLFVVVGVAVVGAIVSLILSGDAYSHIGRGGLSIGEDRPLGRPAGGGSGAPLTSRQRAEQEADIRSMLEARNARRAARGEATGDVEAEMADLLRPAPIAGGGGGAGGGGAGGAGGGGAGGGGAGGGGVDPEIEAEVRQLVESRNARRVARGEEPLDVDAEVQRRLRDLGA